MQELKILEVVAIKVEPELVKSSDATNDEVTNTDVQKKPSIHLMWGPIQRTRLRMKIPFVDCGQMPSRSMEL